MECFGYTLSAYLWVGTGDGIRMSVPPNKEFISHRCLCDFATLISCRNVFSSLAAVNGSDKVRSFTLHQTVSWDLTEEHVAAKRTKTMYYLKRHNMISK